MSDRRDRYRNHVTMALRGVVPRNDGWGRRVYRRAGRPVASEKTEREPHELS
jgi:hypothetical protein